MSTEGFDPGVVPAAVLGICETLRAQGARSWVVGGCVRDQLMGREVSDWDVCTTALPEVLMRVFPKAIATGLAHGTVTVVVHRERYEVTTLRGDGAYSDGRRPDSVVFLDDITEDLARRDFTVNAIAYNVLEGTLVDPFGGARDLREKVLRAVGDARARFQEDGLRILRGARFAATLGFDIDLATEEAMEAAVEVFKKVSPERVRDEWTKCFKAEKPSRGFEVMRRRRILGVTLSTLAEASNEVFSKVMRTLDLCPVSLPSVRLSALLSVFDPSPERCATRADEWLRAYRYANEERARVTETLRHRGIDSSIARSDGDLRRMVRVCEAQRVLGDIFVLRRAELTAEAEGENDELLALGICENRVQGLMAKGVVLSARDLAVDGTTLMSALGIPPSRRLGRIMELLLERVTDAPEENTPERLMSLARELDPGP